MILSDVSPFPIGCETRRYIACLTSLYMYLEHSTNNKHIALCDNHDEHFLTPCKQCGTCNDSKVKLRQQIYQNILTASGIGVTRFKDDFSLLHQCKMIDEIFDYSDIIDDTMDFLSLNYHLLTKRNIKNTVFNEIKESINKNIPVIVRFGAGNYNLIVGYEDEGQVLFGYDGNDTYNTPIITTSGYNPKGYTEDNMFYIEDWFKCIDVVVIVEGKKKRIVKYKYRNILDNITNIIDSQKDIYGQELVEHLADDYYFTNIDDGNIAVFYKHINLYFGFLAEQRGFVGNVLGLHFGKDNISEDGARYLNTAAQIFHNSHDLAFDGWKIAGELRGAHPRTLRNKNIRRSIIKILKMIWENDIEVSKLLKIFKCCENI